MPFIFDTHNITLDYLIAYCLGIFFSITINAEAQAFVAQILGNVCPSGKPRFHFNAFQHLDFPGTIAFFIAGFGWPRRVDIDETKFEHPKIYSIIVQCSGPAANFILASILSSLCLIIEQFSIDPWMFKIVLGINLVVAMSNLLPFPPLAFGIIPTVFIPERYRMFKKIFRQIGPYATVILLVADRLLGIGIVNNIITLVYGPVFGFFIKSYNFG